jgi:hypothetical protein
MKSIFFYNLSPYPLGFTSSEWNNLPKWQKVQLEHDNNNVKLNQYFTTLEEDLENKSITFRYYFKQSNLLPNTPKSWILPKSRFNIHFDLFWIINSIGKSITLFKFINETNKNKPSHKAFNKSDLTKFTKYEISMDISLLNLKPKSWKRCVLN